MSVVKDKKKGWQVKKCTSIKKRRPLTSNERKMVVANLHLPKILAFKAIRSTGGWTGSYTREDLESVGNFALCAAAQDYNPDNKAGASFETYAWYKVQGYIRHALRDKSRVVKMPRWIPKMRIKVRELIQQGKTNEEVAKELDVTVEKVEMCERSWHEIPYPLEPETRDWILFEHNSSSRDNPEMLKYIKSLGEDQILELVKKIESGDLSDERLQTILLFG